MMTNQTNQQTLREGWTKIHYFPVHNKDKGTKDEFDSFILELFQPPFSNKMEDKFLLATSMTVSIKKVRLVAKLWKINSLISLILLFLQGDSLMLYLKMSEEEQKDADLIECEQMQLP